LVRSGNHRWRFRVGTHTGDGGKDGLDGSRRPRRILRTWTEQFDDWTFQVDRLIDAGDDRVVVLIHQRGTGKESGVPVEWNSGVVFELRDGRIIRATNYSTLADALEAAGLRE
jgi:ketosteroid isomerase-like protein